MTGSTLAAPAAGRGIALPAALLPTLVAALLAGGPAAGAPRPQEWPGSPGSGSPGTEAREVREAVPDAPSRYLLDGRSRAEMRFAASNFNVSHDDWTDALDVDGGDFSFAFVHWAGENLALELTLGATNIGYRSRRTNHGEVVRADGLYRVMAGGRFYLPVEGALRPHVDLAGGLLTEVEVDDGPWHRHVTEGTVKAGLEVGGGIDFLLGSHFVVGVRAATLVREGYRSELNVGGSLGWTFGGPASR